MIILLLISFCFSMTLCSYAGGCERMFQKCAYNNYLNGSLWACGVGYAFCVIFVE